MKRIVIYYSLTNNTKEAAEYIAEMLGADLSRIELVKPMPESFGKQMMIGGMQASFGMTPKVNGVPSNISEYDEIILGTPIWAGKVASPINTLLKKYKVSDKITAVFTFSGGGDNDKCMLALRKKLNNIKTSIALADRSNEIACKNQEKLDKFVSEIC